MDTKQETFEILALDGLAARIEDARWPGTWREVPYSTLPTGARIRDKVRVTNEGMVLIAGPRDNEADHTLIAKFADGAIQAIAVALGIPSEQSRRAILSAL